MLNKIHKFIASYNLWSFLYFRYYLGKNVSLKAVCKFASKQECNTLAKAASSLDVIDGIGWICLYVAVLILTGYIWYGSILY